MFFIWKIIGASQHEKITLVYFENNFNHRSTFFFQKYRSTIRDEL
jgi:hypothetical protein